ncbi:GspH/FimT family pseudopilin [Undibacterium sp. Di24W]|uniref:GspH/FimT family pseudopilin n=1 Tax=Undibacterium sp. Di24W TaxID=3413033 RepID=UPI003BF0E6A7
MKYKMLHAKFSAGVTLIELLVVMALIGLLSTMAIPSYRNIMVSSRTANLASSLHSTILLARSEALKRGARIVICKSSNADSAAATCDNANGGIGWAQGWILFVEDDGTPGRSPQEVLIRAQGQLLQDVSEGSILPSDGNNLITFNSTGQIPAAVNFVVAGPSDYSSSNRAVCIGIGGRARIGKAPTCT